MANFSCQCMCLFFSIRKKKMKRKKRNVSEETHILQHRVLRKLSLSFCKNSPSVPLINSAATEDPCSVCSAILLHPVGGMHTCWSKYSSGLIFLPYTAVFRFFFFSQQVMAHRLLVGSELQCGMQCTSSSHFTCISLVAPPPPSRLGANHVRWLGCVEDWNKSYLGSYCSTHVMCNLPDPERLE